MKFFSPFVSCIAFSAALSIPASALAAIDLIPKEVTIEKDATPVRVINNGDRTEYVSISLSRLLNPGVPLENERLEAVGDTTQPSLYAYPFRLTLAPGQTKTITLKQLRSVDTETVYRLDVKPEIKVLGAEQKKMSANVVVNLGFSGLVRELPSSVREGLAVACDASGAQLTVTGNVRYRVEGAKADGRSLDKFNVYPGTPLPVPGHVVEIPGHPVCKGAATN
ncbi:hypothetical protein DIE07_15330 [Burkholderia sp. Bp9002]|nr:hypothetical protein DIE07_15330 [Burkholderia sp. Bp9002]